MAAVCGSCGQEHALEDLQIGFVAPEAYLSIPEEERAERASVTLDWCILDGKRCFLRGVFEVPILGGGTPFGWGAWVEVEESFYRAWAAGRRAPFPAQVDSELWGYPRHPGPIQALVQPSGDAAIRPALMATDPEHPLTSEQQHGISRQRALDLLAPVLHSEPGGPPFLATLVASGWTLDDRAFAERSGGLYWLPPEAERLAVQAGELVQLLFRIATEGTDGGTDEHVERMWVRVDGRSGDLFTGRLVNDPHAPGRMARGLRVWFGTEHVVDIVHGDGSQASTLHQLVRCGTHGMSQPSFVCRHVATGEGLGFHTSQNPDSVRPDAWCDACDEVFLAEGGEWTERAEEKAHITLLCAGCYDEAKARSLR
jgi:hypothetical protein